MRAAIESLVISPGDPDGITTSIHWGGSLEPFSYQDVEHYSSVESFGEPVLVPVRFDFVEPDASAQETAAV